VSGIDGPVGKKKAGAVARPGFLLLERVPD
jgi:hypothetical protein